MKQVMWSVFNSKSSKVPRAIFSSKRGADSYHSGMHWGITVRVEIDYKEEERVVIVRPHEYRIVEDSNL